MKQSLEYLSDNEYQLYKDIHSLSGTMEDRTQQLSEDGTYNKYREIHQHYLELLNSTTDNKIKIEALKRLTFLNWLSILEPSCFTGVENLVAACAKVNSFLVHVSTDFIFDGTFGPLDESAIPKPVNYYGESKLAGEKVVMNG